MTTTSIEELFVHNREWADQMERDRPGFFTGLMAQQKPKYMWIGCSDSRVPPTRSRVWSLARCSCTATWPTWWCPAT
jgi:hypothetical protein